ncbi:MAG: hypothetical protein H7839_16795 [Magnetococcus sp. YQC-5]
MSRSMCAHILNQAKLWQWVLTTCLLFIMNHAMAAGPNLPIPDARPTIPSNPPNSKNIDKWLPEEVELFDEPTYLKSLCVNLNGLSFNKPKKVTSAQSEGSQEEHWSESDLANQGVLTQLFKKYFGGEHNLDDKCLGIAPEKACQKINCTIAVNKKDQDDENKIRLNILFNANQSRWTSLWNISRFVKCITKNYRNKINEKEDPICQAIFKEEESHFLLQAFQKDKPNYFLSRAFLPAQKICGVNLNEKSQDIFQKQIQDCQSPSIVNVELVEGRIEKIIVKQPRTIKPFPVAIANSFTSIETESSKLLNFFKESNSTNEHTPLQDQTDSTNDTIFRKYKVIILHKEYQDAKKTKKIKELLETIKKDTDEDKDLLKELIMLTAKHPELFHNQMHNFFSDSYHKEQITLETYLDLNRSFAKIIEYYKEQNPSKEECQFYQEHPTTTPKTQQELCKILNPLKQEKPLSRWPLERTLINTSDLPGFALQKALLNPPSGDTKKKDTKKPDNPPSGDTKGKDTKKSDNPPSGDSKERDTTELDISWDFQRWDWAAGMDNYGSKAMGPNLLWNRLDLHYFIWPGDKASWLHVRTTDEGELAFNQLDYRFPLWSHDFHGRVGVTMDHSKLGDTYRPLDIQSKKSSKELAMEYTFQQDRHMKTSIEGGLFLNEIKTTLLDSDYTQDKVTKGFLKWQTNYHNQIHERGIKAMEEGLPGMTDLFFTLGTAHGLKWFNNYIKPNGINTTNPEATPDFYQLKVNLKGVREFQKIARDPNNQPLTTLENIINSIVPIPTSRVYASGEMTGQWSSEPLVSSEKISFGGRQFGAAYDSGKITGDHALGIKGEVGWKFMLGSLICPTPCNQNDETPITQIFEWSPFGFTEFAQVWNKDAQSQLLRTDYRTFTTGGGGLRIKYRPEFWEQRQKSKDKSDPLIPINQISGELMFAWPLGSKEVPSTHTPEWRFGVVLQMFVPEVESSISK